MKRLIVTIAVSLVGAFCFAQAGPADISPLPKESSVSEGFIVWPYKVSVDLGDRDLRRRVYHLPEFAHKAAYEITVDADGVVIKAVTVEALFYAQTSLSQMMARSDTLQRCHILDWPAAEVRVRSVDLCDGSVWNIERLLYQVDFARFEKRNVLRVVGSPAAFAPEQVERLAEYAGKNYVTVEWVPGTGHVNESITLY